MSNILPKKSWHVYNDKNREKVRHDEEILKIADEVKVYQQKQDERDARLFFLRKRQKEEVTILFPTDDDSSKGSYSRTSTVEVGYQTNSDKRDSDYFELFPTNLLSKSRLEAQETLTQRLIRERSNIIEPMALGSAKLHKRLWYEEIGSRMQGNAVLAHQHEDPINTIRRSKSRESLQKLAPLQQRLRKSIETLRLERLEREKMEREIFYKK